jgi:sigma-B regulation protein RsbU (phosphoserine phosphatase)
MCSYSRCLHDSTGQAVAVLAADVPLRELSAMATQLIENQHRSLIGIIALQVLGLLTLGFIIHRSVKNIRRLQAEQIEKERFLSELSVARDIQQSMIPKTFPGYPDRDDVELYASLTPARQVGGDFYDFIFSGSRICFCIGDVTGKGIPAALLMTVTRSFFRTEATRALNQESPDTLPGRKTPDASGTQEHLSASIVQGMNQILYEEQSSGYFATLFVGVLDLRTGQLDYCNAGHEAPLIINQKNNMKEKTLPVRPNLPVGALDDWDFEGQQAQLQPDDMLLLYTDGLTEAKNEEGQFLTRQRVHEIAQQAAGRSPREVVEQMEASVKQHAGHAEQSDDITLLCLKWKKKELELKADIEELSRMKDFVVDAAGQAGLSTKDTKRLRLAVEEAVTNVIMYAYDGCQSRPLSIRTNTTDDALLVTVTDEGRPFDPTKAPMADTTLPPDKRPEGGLGILFIHQMSDGLDYRREDGRNILTIRKNLNAKYAS